MTELIILLDGNFASVKVNDKDVNTITEQLKDIMRGKVDPVNKIYTIGHITVLLNRVIGYYTRPVVETAQDKLVKILEKTVEADGWKDGEDWKS